ncbi:hypothetical protein G7054_g7625 [Neopestalotiopsis clavispora]|nr:hypothetical protein G7054_g7625 [Neopestalotiopsis clavispora]
MLLVARRLQARCPVPPQQRYNYASMPSGSSRDTNQGITSKISQVIQEDHRQLEYCYRRIKDAQDADEKSRFQNAFIWELTRHSISEELVVYPEIENRISGGQAIANEDRQQHQVFHQLKNKLYEFQKLSPTDPNFSPLLESIYQDLQQHIAQEESDDLVALEQAISSAESSQLRTLFERTKAFTPTRSHPSAPNKPPFETVVGLMTAPVDKLRDLFRKFPEGEDATRSRSHIDNTGTKH